MIELIVNPTAGNGRASEMGEKVAQKLKALNIPFQMHITDRPRHATEIARQAAQRGAETVIALGLRDPALLDTVSRRLLSGPVWLRSLI